MGEKEIIFEKEKELVILRLESLYPDYCYTSGDGSTSFSRDEMIKEIRQGSAVGIEIVKIDMDFLRALKDGTLLKRLNEVTATV
jgi:hypothetical protein